MILKFLSCFSVSKMTSTATCQPSPALPTKPTTVATTDLRLRLKSLLTQQKHTDCSFRVDNTTINCHKVILSTASPVFEAMFFGPLAETCCIDITDISREAFQLMLEFVYTDEVDMSQVTQIEDLMELYYCANKYLLVELMVSCDQLIRKTLRHDNILQAIDMAVSMNVAELLDITVNFFTKYCLIGRFFANCILQNDFHISKECLNYILSSDIKQQNINLVCLVKKWCRTEAKQRALRPEDIRQTLSGVRIPDDILSDVENLQSLVVADSAALMQSSRLAWTVCQRQYFRAVRPLRIEQEQQRSFETSIESNRFTALRSLIINSRLTPFVRTRANAAHLAGEFSKYTEQLTVTIWDKDDAFRLAQTFVVFNTEYNSTCSLVFESPVMLTPDTCYAVRFDWAEATPFGCEYPLSVMSPEETLGGGMCCVQFDRSLRETDVMLNQQGSLLSGVELVILS